MNTTHGRIVIPDWDGAQIRRGRGTECVERGALVSAIQAREAEMALAAMPDDLDGSVA